MFCLRNLPVWNLKSLESAYGLSYEEREITEPLYEKILPEKRGIASILLAHGGDEKHIRSGKNELLKLGYDYIALGHIHLPAELAKDRMYYAGSPGAYR